MGQTSEIKREYYTFAGTLANIFGRDWDKVVDQVDTSWKFLSHIPDVAWPVMTQLAANMWEGWPRNWPKAVKEVYIAWGKQEKYERTTTECENCNGNGFFSGYKKIEVKPDLWMTYSYTWRCKGCRNWYGVIGDKVPEAWPLEMKQQGFEIIKYSNPLPAESRYRSLAELLETVGTKTNTQEYRPKIQHYDDEVPF